MAIVLASGSNAQSFVQLITVLLIFALVLVITTLTTRFIGGYQRMQGKNRNLEIIESARVANNKYVQIIRTADKYIVIGVGKNEVSMLTEIDGDALINISPESDASKASFADIINKASAAFRKADDSAMQDDKKAEE